MNSTASRLITNTSWLYAKILVNMFVTLLTTRIILAGLGASDFGIFNIVGGAITMLGFFNSTMSHATQRFMNYCEGEGDALRQKQIFNVAIVLHFIVAIIMGVILFYLGFFNFEDILNIPSDRLFAAKVVYSCLVASTVFTIMSSPYEAAMNAHENFRYFAIISVFENILKLIVALVCYYTTQDKLICYGVLMTCISFVTLSIMRYYCHKNYIECIFLPMKYFSKKVTKELASFAGWNFMAATTSLLGHYGMGLVLNHFFGVILNAAQGVAVQIGNAFMNLSSNALKAITPILTKSEGANNRERVYYMTLLGCRVPFMITTIFTIPLYILTPQILDIWLEEVPLWAVLFTRLQIIKNILDLLFNNLNSAIYAQGNIKLFSFTSSFFFILPLFLAGYAFKLGYPPYTLYIIWIIVNVLGGFNSLFVCNYVTGLSITSFIYNVLVPCISVLLVSLIPYYFTLFYTCSLILIIISSFLSSLLFLSLGWKFIIIKNEREILCGFFFSIIKKIVRK